MGLTDLFRKSGGISFDAVDTLRKAEAMEKEGVLERMYLMPLELGGEDHPRNTVLVPRGTACLKEEVDSMIADLVRVGEITGYRAELEYGKKSAVPRKVIVHATKNGSERFTQTVNLW